MSHDLAFLRQYEPPVIKRRRAMQRAFVWISGILGLAVLAWATVMAVALGTMYTSALDGRDALISARDRAAELDFDAASVSLQEAERHLSKTVRAADFLSSVSLIPWVRQQGQAASGVGRSGLRIAASLGELLDLGSELIRLSGLEIPDLQAILEGTAPAMTFDDLPSEAKRAILLRLSSAADDLEVSKQRVAIALDDLARIPREGLFAPVRDALDPIQMRLQQFLEDLEIMTTVAQIVPAFAGLDEPRTTLLLLLNNAELRPGGGFIGTFGVVSTKDGDIASMTTRDVYHLDWAAQDLVTASPPAPLRKYLGLSKWFFRDANWSPDFAVSSRLALERFRAEASVLSGAVRAELGIPLAIHHVIGITPDFASNLLRLTGPVTVGGQTFTAENIFETLEYQVEFGYAKQGIPQYQRKEILADLVEEMKAKIFALPVRRWEEVIAALNQSVREKQLLLYSEDQKTEDVLTRAGWGGRVLPSGGDLILVADANLGSLKTDPVVQRAIVYEVEKNTSGQLIGRVTVVYRHDGIFDYKTTRYRTYTRLYVPLGSQWIRTSGSLADDRTKNPTLAASQTDVGEEMGMTTFGAFTAVEPGETRELAFEFLLAPEIEQAIENGTYELTVLKQPGAAKHTLTLELDFDKKLSNASPPEERSQWGDDVYRLNTILDQDRHFSAGL